MVMSPFNLDMVFFNYNEDHFWTTQQFNTSKSCLRGHKLQNLNKIINFNNSTD